MVTFGGNSFSRCQDAKFESKLPSSHDLLLDLSKLHTIVFNGPHTLEGNDEDENMITINNQDTYDNKLVMRSRLSRSDK